ncbi:MAG: hypothetical protein KH375_03885 [Alistipes sp.]|nr:hypothetical protein [Alistipes sp.]
MRCYAWFCLVLFGFVWFCLVWFGLVWFGLVWFGLVWFGLVWFGLVWFGLVWFGLVWFGLVWFGLVWFGLVWFGLVWFGLANTLMTLTTLKSLTSRGNLYDCRFNVLKVHNDPNDLKDFNIVKELFFFRIVHRSEEISQRNFIEITE